MQSEECNEEVDFDALEKITYRHDEPVKNIQKPVNKKPRFRKLIHGKQNIHKKSER
jgi:hypothetical protein